MQIKQSKLTIDIVHRKQYDLTVYVVLKVKTLHGLEISLPTMNPTGKSDFSSQFLGRLCDGIDQLRVGVMREVVYVILPNAEAILNRVELWRVRRQKMNFNVVHFDGLWKIEF